MTTPGRYNESNLEPPLDEILADRMVRLLIRRDRIDTDSLLATIDKAQRKLASKASISSQGSSAFAP